MENVYHFEHPNYIKFQNAMKILSILTLVQMKITTNISVTTIHKLLRVAELQNVC